MGYDESLLDDDMDDADGTGTGTRRVLEVKFGQVYLSKPTTVEKDGTVTSSPTRHGCAT